MKGVGKRNTEEEEERRRGGGGPALRKTPLLATRFGLGAPDPTPGLHVRLDAG
jgi:hypothetical protein